MQGNQRQTLLAYTAGILDSDGCFMIIKQKRKTIRQGKFIKVEKHCPSYMPTIKIAMVQYEAIDAITEELGYGTYHREGARPSRPNSMRIYAWYLRGMKVISLLDEIIPFLRVKKERAKFLREFTIHLKDQPLSGCSGLSMEELNYREESYLKMRELNSSKVAATTKSLRPERVSDSLIL